MIDGIEIIENERTNSNKVKMLIITPNLTFSGDTAIKAYDMRMRVEMFEN